MKKELVLTIALLLSVIILAACGAASAAPAVNAGREAPEEQPPAAEEPASDGTETSGDTLIDEQGAVVVSVTPLNLGQDSATLDFEVALNTHSVDLSMDLAQLATLSTDSGATVRATAWDAPQGGHHVSGVLSFATEGEGPGMLENATSVVLTIENLDVPTRTFTWNIQ